MRKRIPRSERERKYKFILSRDFVWIRKHNRRIQWTTQEMSEVNERRERERETEER